MQKILTIFEHHEQLGFVKFSDIVEFINKKIKRLDKSHKFCIEAIADIMASIKK